MREEREEYTFYYSEDNTFSYNLIFIISLHFVSLYHGEIPIVKKILPLHRFAEKFSTYHITNPSISSSTLFSHPAIIDRQFHQNSEEHIQILDNSSLLTYPIERIQN